MCTCHEAKLSDMTGIITYFDTSPLFLTTNQVPPCDTSSVYYNPTVMINFLEYEY